jgi:YegS/Rv2252/BmrU family lipid kinase
MERKRGSGMEKVLIIANPSSGEKEATEISKKLVDIFKQKDIETTLYETEGEDNFQKLTYDALEEGVDTVALLGGDGTVSEFVTQISDLPYRPNILLLPLGTTNNFARALQAELDLDDLLAKIEKGEMFERQTDVGKINEGYFISTLSAGSLPEIAWQTDDELKEVFGPFGYILEGITSINEEEEFDLHIQTETEDIKLEEITLVVIGLTNSVFGIPTFFEEGDVDDGQLQLYALKTSNLLSEAASLAHHIFPNKYENKTDDDELSYTTSFRKASLRSSKTLNLAIDGEKGPTFPIELDVLHNHLTFFVSLTEQ